MPKALRLEDAYTLRDQGKYSEARQAFREIKETTDDVFVKANAQLGAAMATVGLGDNNLARQQLIEIRKFLGNYEVAANPREEFELQRLRIVLEIQEAIIEAAEGNAQAAIDRYDSLMEHYKTDLLKQDFSDIRDTLYGEKAFLLADNLFFEEALPILEELKSPQSRNSSVLFYLGYCYMAMKKHSAAREKLEKAIALGLVGSFRFRAHWALGITLCELGDYVNARVELQKAGDIASPRDVIEGKIFQWLEYCCNQLGLTRESAEYARLAGRQ